MMGQLPPSQNTLFYDFFLEKFVSQDHLLRQIEPLLDLSDLRDHLASYYSHTGRPSVDPKLMIRMLIVGYCYGIPRNDVCVRKCILIWPTGGFAGWAWKARYPTIPRSPRTGMDGSERVILFGICSSWYCSAAWPKVWWVVKDLRPMRVS